MRQVWTFRLLVLVNVVLLVLLVKQWREGRNVQFSSAAQPVEGGAEGVPVVSEAQGLATVGAAERASDGGVFAQVYSPNLGTFVANLRACGCPEETVKDILVAEVGRRLRGREESLRPTGADHVPYGWFPETVDASLLERREEARALAQQKRELLRSVLGYDVPVELPRYARRKSDEEFAQVIEAFPDDQRAAVQAIQDQYWIGVSVLRTRCQDFWQSEDVAALERLKAERLASLAQLAEQQP